MAFKLEGESHPDRIDITVGDDDVAIRIKCEKNINKETQITVHKKFGFNGILSKIPLAIFTKKIKIK